MSTREFFAKKLASEIPTFMRVFRAMPEDRLDYKPHERSTAAGALAWQLAMEAGMLAELAETGEMHYAPMDQPPLEEIASSFERSANLVVERARAATDELWHGPSKMISGDNVVSRTSVENLAWSFLFDMIHHRGQLTAYLRPMGGKVPSIYGPSGDDAG